MTSPESGSEQTHQTQGVRLVVDAIPALAWSARSNGSADFFNQRWLDYTGLSVEQARDWGWTAALHPDDLKTLVDYWKSVLASGQPGEIEGRLGRFDGMYRWFLFRATPLLDDDGKIVKWFGTNTDIEDRKRAELLLAGENLVLEMTAKGDSMESVLEALCRVVEQTASGCLCSVLVLDPTGSRVRHAVAPSLPCSYNDRFAGIPVGREGGPCTEAACRKTQVIVSDVASDTRRDMYGWCAAALTHGLKACWSTPILASNGLVLGTFAVYWREPRSPSEQDQKIIAQVTHLAAVAIERQRNEAELRDSQERFRLIVDTIPGLVWTMNASGEVESANQQTLGYFGKTLEELKEWVLVLHPDDRTRVLEYWRFTIESGQPYELEHRLLGADGVYRWFQARGRPQRDAEGCIVLWYNLLTDIDDRKRAEGKLEKAFDEKAKSEAELRTIIDAIPQLIIAIGTDGNFLSANQAVLEYTGLTKEEVGSERFREVFHPEDSERLRDERAAVLSRGLPFEYERRVRRSDGQYRWFLVQYNPLRNERGEIIRWYATGTDIDDRKQAEERTQQENIALREQIDQVFMFEEIVGSSPALKTVVSNIVKVAPTDSTVLITGETGTGKELVARGIHRSSQRASQPFVTVNCASIPSSLVASELFGHEKGAFTGALQRRQGRFELANSGTIFLDEIGELPPETQIALLRVLQERRFERVGSSRAISTNVRIIAATNRDLAAAVASETFRADLFYRLNVFPIDVPPLRRRKEDIPMLVEYFVKRYAGKAGKQIHKIDGHTMNLCQSYHWPGNIRELQNIVERSVILCSGDTLWIDEAWLSNQDASREKSSGLLTENVLNYEKGLIEAALAESKGKVAGPSGAAAKLGIPRSTLDLKIKKLNIKNNLR